MNVFTVLSITFLLSVGASVSAYFVISRRPRVKWIDLSPRVANRIFIALALGYVVVLGALSLLKHFSFAASSLDLAQYDQLIWNSLHGHLLEGSMVRDAPLFLAKSFTPILLAFVPLYAVWSDPIVLLIVQTLALGLAGWPIYCFAKERVGSTLGVIVATAFYLSPALEYMNLDDFHEITLAVPLLAFALYFLLRYRHKAFLVCLAVAFLVKEEIALITAALGVFIFLFQRTKRLGLVLTALGGLAAWVLLQYVIPFFRGAESGDFYYLQRYGYLGRTLPGILTTLVTSPAIVLQHLLIPGKIEYALQLLTPLAFVPLVGVEIFALTLLTFGYTLLSDVSWQYSVQTAYPAPLMPFLFFATIIGLQRILAWGKRVSFFEPTSRKPQTSAARQWAVGILILFSSGLSYYFQAPGPLALPFSGETYTLHVDTFREAAWMRSIPSDAVVVAQNEFLAHVSRRQFVYEIPTIPDYRQADYLIADTTKPWYGVHLGYWNEYLRTGYFETITTVGGYLIAKRRLPDQPRPVQFGGHVKLLAYAIVPTETLTGGMSVRPILLLQADSQNYNVMMQVVDAQGHLWAEEDREPGKFARPDERQAGKPLDDQYELRLPPTMPAGDYQITLAVHKADSPDNLEAVDEQGHALGTEVVLATRRIEKNKSSFVVSALGVEQPLYADMQEMRFLGYVPPRQTIAPGELLQVGLYWRARAKPRGDYIVAVQLRDPASRLAVEHAVRPANGTYPTTGWDTGEVLLDWHDFYLPQDIAAGEYAIHVVLRDAADQRVLGDTQLGTLLVIQ